MLRALRERVKKTPVIGPFLHRLYLAAVFHEGQDETIRGGVLEGMKFRRFMHTFVQEYVQGDYESEIQDVLASRLKPGQVVYDVGANAGFITLVAAKLVGPSGAV